MNRKTALVTGGLAATFVAATAFAVPALAASAGAKTVTEHCDAKGSSAPLLFGKTSFVSTDNDVTSGKTIGHDVLSCTNAATSSHRHVALAQKGGILYVQFTLSDKTGALKDVKITLHYKK